MKIKKHQTGGIVYTPFMPNRGQVEQTSSKTEKEDKPEKISGTFTKEIIDVLKENGIPNDVDNFLAQANSFLSRSTSLSELSIFGGKNESDHNLSDIIKVQALANKVKFNKELYDSATKQLSTERAWSEIAMDDKGKMYVYSEEGINLIDPTEYYKNMDSYTALTNSQLLSLRENQNDLSFNQSILNNINNSVGMESIVNYIKGIVKDFGTATVEGYTGKDKDRIENGFRDLLMNGPDGYYKYTMKSQIGEDASDAQLALDYLYTSLPNNMKHLLKGKTAAEGGNPNSMDTRRLLAMALTEHTSETRAVNFDSSATASTGKGGKDAMVQDSYIERLADQSFAHYEPVRITPANSQVSIIAQSQDKGPLVKRNMDSVEQNNLKVLMNEVWEFQVVDKTSVTWGDQLLTQEDWNKILWDGQSNITGVWMPSKNVNGHVVPDFQVQDRLSEVNQYINDHPGITDMQIKEIIKDKFGNDAKFDRQTGSVKLGDSKMTQFLSISAYAGDDSLDFNTKSPYLEKVDSNKGSQLTDRYDNYMWYDQETKPKDGKKKTNDSRSTSGDFYKGNVFIPITNLGAGVHLGNNEYRTRDTYSMNSQGGIQGKVERRTNALNNQVITNW